MGSLMSFLAFSQDVLPKSKVEGNFLVHNISRPAKGTMLVEFKALDPNTIKKILLYCDQLNAHIKLGERFKISAEVQMATESVAVARQIMIFPDGSGIETPIWVTSKSEHLKTSAPKKGLLKLHSPSTDYSVL